MIELRRVSLVLALVTLVACQAKVGDHATRGRQVVGLQKFIEHHVGQFHVLDAGLRPAFERLAVAGGPRRVLV